jgi:hypothetical protein
MEYYKEIGRKYNYSQEQIEEYGRIIAFLAIEAERRRGK